jgi:hypothetical protein
MEPTKSTAFHLAASGMQLNASAASQTQEAEIPHAVNHAFMTWKLDSQMP